MKDKLLILLIADMFTNDKAIQVDYDTYFESQGRIIKKREKLLI